MVSGASLFELRGIQDARTALVSALSEIINA